MIKGASSNIKTGDGTISFPLVKGTRCVKKSSQSIWLV
jgi:hypothetical protein